jgi:hypothetical protein
MLPVEDAKVTENHDIHFNSGVWAGVVYLASQIRRIVRGTLATFWPFFRILCSRAHYHGISRNARALSLVAWNPMRPRAQAFPFINAGKALMASVIEMLPIYGTHAHPHRPRIPVVR